MVNNTYHLLHSRRRKRARNLEEQRHCGRHHAGEANRTRHPLANQRERLLRNGLRDLGGNLLPLPFESIAAHGGERVLYFRGDNPAGDGELWRSNGTAVCTVLVKDISPGVDYENDPKGAAIHYLTGLNSVLYFAADNGTASERATARKALQCRRKTCLCG